MSTFASMRYPHWLIVAGAALLAVGLAGLAFGQRVVEAEPDATASDQEVEPAALQAEQSGQEAKKKRRDRWAERFAPSREP
jgi:hypothetical protein